MPSRLAPTVAIPRRTCQYVQVLSSHHPQLHDLLRTLSRARSVPCIADGSNTLFAPVVKVKPGNPGTFSEPEPTTNTPFAPAQESNLSYRATGAVLGLADQETATRAYARRFLDGRWHDDTRHQLPPGNLARMNLAAIPF
jgi:hypothetical protein